MYNKVANVLADYIDNISEEQRLGFIYLLIDN